MSENSWKWRHTYLSTILNEMIDYFIFLINLSKLLYTFWKSICWKQYLSWGYISVLLCLLSSYFYRIIYKLFRCCSRSSVVNLSNATERSALTLRASKLQLVDSYVLLKDGEAWLLGSHITPLMTASTHVIADPVRTRKLLLNAYLKQIKKYYN